MEKTFQSAFFFVNGQSVCQRQEEREAELVLLNPKGTSKHCSISISFWKEAENLRRSGPLYRFTKQGLKMESSENKQEYLRKLQGWQVEVPKNGQLFEDIHNHFSAGKYGTWQVEQSVTVESTKVEIE